MKVRSTLHAAILSLILGVPMLGGQAHAASVSFFLDQSNAFDDGVNYLQVTIEDNGTDIDFTVDILSPPLIAGNNFGIDQFYFNVGAGSDATAASVMGLPTFSASPTWEARDTGPTRADGFGDFDILVATPCAGFDQAGTRCAPGIDRQSPLMFSISDIDGDSPSDYAVLSTGNAGEGNVFFAAHVAGLNEDPDSAFFGGSSTLVPIPAAVWLFGSGLIGLLGIAKKRRAA